MSKVSFQEKPLARVPIRCCPVYRLNEQSSNRRQGYHSLARISKGKTALATVNNSEVVNRQHVK